HRAAHKGGASLAGCRRAGVPAARGESLVCSGTIPGALDVPGYSRREPMAEFQLVSDFHPTGDQPQAIDQLLHGLERGQRHQTLLGVTGSGKTYTVANVMAQVQRPTLVIAHKDRKSVV